MSKYLLLLICFLSQLSYSQDLNIRECFTDDTAGYKYCIATDSITFDNNSGDSYRLFLVLSAENDSVISKDYLEINRSPDFPYILDTSFVDEFDILIIKGTASLYIYRTLGQTISGWIIPDYTGCEFSDMQGYFISNLKIRSGGSVLELQVLECGIHQFDIADFDSIREIR